MAVTYTKQQRKYAQSQGLHLVTISARGVEFQGAVSEEESQRLLAYLAEFFERRSLARQAAREAAESSGVVQEDRHDR